jgi:hypothetical protein
MTTMHTRQLQQYTHDNYNNTHVTTTTIHTWQLTTIHTRHLKIQHVQKVNNTKVRKYCIQFPVFFPTHNLITLSPQPFTSHHFTTHINFSHKVSFSPFPTLHFTSVHFTSLHFISLHFTSLHFISLHFTSLLDDFHFILLRFSTLLDGLYPYGRRRDQS